jgi:hypothetical protein
MSMIIIEHEDPNLVCINQHLCDKLFEHDQIYVPLPIPKLNHAMLPFDHLNQKPHAKPINLLDIKEAKKLIQSGMNVILEGTVSKAINKQLQFFDDNHTRRISLAVNHPQTIIHLSPIDEMIDVHALNLDEITDKLIKIILSSTKKTT